MSSYIEFSQTIYSTFEPESGTSPRQVILVLSRTGDLNTSALVELSLTSATATEGQDYYSALPFPETVYFGAGETTKTIVIDITDDMLLEGTEYLNLELSSQDPNVILGQNSTTLEILDNETSYVQFAQTSYTVEEGTTSPHQQTITLMRTGNLNQSSQVQLQLDDGSTAVLGEDYEILDANGTPIPSLQDFFFNPGETTKTFQIRFFPDFQLEGTESINFQLVSTDGQTAIGSNSSTGISILDAQTAYVEFSQATYVILEGENSPSRVAITLTRKGDLGMPAEVNLGVLGGTATEMQDYVVPFNSADPIFFDPGETTKTIWIDILSDGMPEGTETLQFQLTGLNGTTIGSQDTATLHIRDRQSTYIEFAQTDYWIEEGEDTRILTLTLTRQGNLHEFADVQLLLNGGSAQQGMDYQLFDANGTPLSAFTPISFNPGEQTKILQVEIPPDYNFEGTESFSLSLISDTGSALIGTNQTTTVHILDDETPYVEFAHAVYTAYESSGNGSQIAITLTRKGDITQFAHVQLQPLGGSAKLYDDYYSPVLSGSMPIEFNPGEMSKTIWLDINPDGQPEGLESTQFQLVGVHGTAIGQQHTTTLNIVDRETAQVQFAQADYVLSEGENQPRHIALTITRQGNLNQSSEVQLMLAGGSAEYGRDYRVLDTEGNFPLNLPYPIYFNPNETERTVILEVPADFEWEGTETAQFQLIPTAFPGNPTVIGTQNTATLHILDSKTTYVEFAQAVYTGFESNGTPTQMAITLVRQGNINLSADVALQVAGGTASRFMDYHFPGFNGFNHLIHFAPGETQKTFWVDIAPDGMDEGTETVQFQLVGSHDTVIGRQNTTTLNLVDYTPYNPTTTVEFAQTNYTILEGTNTPTGQLTITLVRQGDINQVAEVDLFLNGGTAQQGEDYQIVDAQGYPLYFPAPIQFAAGEQTKTLQIDIAPDQMPEGVEFFTLQLGNSFSSQTRIGPTDTTTVHILDDELPVVEFAQATYIVEEGVNSTATLTLSRSGNLVSSSVVRLLVNGGSASEGMDYGWMGTEIESIVFDPGESTKTISVDIGSDGLLEGTELAQFELVSLEPSTLIGKQRTTTLQILDQQTAYVEFAQVAYTIKEDFNTPQPVSITLMRRGDLTQGTDVQLLLNGGSAQQGMDYELWDEGGLLPFPAWISFAPGESSKTIHLNALPDGMLEGMETVHLQLMNATPQTAIGVNAQTTITIADAEPKPTFDLMGEPTVLEDEPYTLSIMDTNMEMGELYLVDWGDGSNPEQYTEGQTIQPHIYAQDGTYTITVTAQDDDGDIVTKTLDVQVDPLNPGGSSVARNDFTGDGNADILWRHSESGNTRLSVMNQQGYVDRENSLPPKATAWQIASTKDFTGDGITDILWRHTEGGTRLGVMNNQGQIDRENLLGPREVAWQVAAADDFTGDGITDILWRHSEGGTRIGVMNNQGYVERESLLGVRDTAWQVAATDDFNGDGITDILWRHSGGGIRLNVINNQGQIDRENLLGPREVAWQIAATDDFNGDGITDILWRHSEGARRISVMNNQGYIDHENLLGPRDVAWQIVTTSL